VSHKDGRTLRAHLGAHLLAGAVPRAAPGPTGGALLTSFTPTTIGRVCPACHDVYPQDVEHVCPLGAHPAPATDRLIGCIISNRYEIKKVLGEGGNGIVYQAKHKVLPKLFAVKLLLSAQDKLAQQRFLLEAESACQIGHPHIVEVTDFGLLPDGCPFLVMEHLPGKTVEALLQGGTLPPLRACRLGRQIALGVQAAHDRGILHRDLKPANLFVLERDGQDFIKIIDFGIAKVFEQERGAGGPTGQMVLGTPEYMSPEQATGEKLDPATDQYSLGCILYEMLTGQPPFGGETSSQIMVKHVTGQPTPLRQRRPDLAISAELEAIVGRCLAKEAAERYPSMRDLAAALDEEAARLCRPGAQTIKEGGAAPVPDRRTRPEDRPSAPPAADPAAGAAPPPAPRPAPPAPTDLLPGPAAETAMLTGPVSPARRRPLLGLAAGAGVGAVLLLVLALRPWQRPAATPAPEAKPPVAVPVAPSSPKEERSTSKEGTGVVTPPPPTKEQKVRIVFENTTSKPVRLSCPGQRECTAAQGKACTFQVSAARAGGECQAEAPGYKGQSYALKDLVRRARGGAVRQPVLLQMKSY